MAIKKINLEIGHTLEEWAEKYGEDENCWDFPIEELTDGTIEPNEGIVYWAIGDRVYETT